MKLQAYLISLILFLSACGSIEKPDHQLNELAGLWIASEGPLLYEEWRMVADQSFTGRSFSINVGDTFQLEAMRMALHEDKLHFFARVPGQNLDQEVRFALVSEEPGCWTFENPSHDYPNRIIYRIDSDTSLYARIENMKGNKKKEFRFRRIGL